MSDANLSTAGVILVVVPSVIYGGVSLLQFLTRKTAGYLDNPLRQNLFRAGHAHAGVLVILALVGLLYLDAANLPTIWRTIARSCLVAAPILMPLGFFLSVASPRASKPNGMIAFVYLGAVALTIGTVTLGVGLLR